MGWHKSKEIFEKECVGYPGFVTKFRVTTADAQGDKVKQNLFLLMMWIIMNLFAKEYFLSYAFYLLGQQRSRGFWKLPTRCTQMAF